jgi:Spy/CpxP family protein refolding chaperone
MSLNKKVPVLLLSLAAVLCAGSSLQAQDWPGGDKGGPPMERMRGMEHGRWWDNPRLTQELGITDDQKKKMDDIFQQHKLKLIDLDAALRKQEAIMQPLMEADQQDETKILAQIDAIAQARAELEKDRARMLYSIRQTLTPEQWKKLQTMAHEGPRGMGGERGPGAGRGWNRGGPDGGAAPKSQQPPAPPGGGDE